MTEVGGSQRRSRWRSCGGISLPSGRCFGPLRIVCQCARRMCGRGAACSPTRPVCSAWYARRSAAPRRTPTSHVVTRCAGNSFHPLRRVRTGAGLAGRRVPSPISAAWLQVEQQRDERFHCLAHGCHLAGAHQRVSKVVRPTLCDGLMAGLAHRAPDRLGQRPEPKVQHDRLQAGVRIDEQAQLFPRCVRVPFR